MKGNVFFLVFCMLLSCQNDSVPHDVPLTANLLHGSWQLVETYISPGGKTDWTAVENGDIFTFYGDGHFARTNTLENKSDGTGTYDLKDGILETRYIRDNGEIRESFTVQISANTMTLSPAGPMICIEPCLYGYRRIN